MSPFFAFFKAIGLIRYSDKEIENIDILDERYHGHGGITNWNKKTDGDGPTRLPGISDADSRDENSIGSLSDDNTNTGKAFAVHSRSLDGSLRSDGEHLAIGGVEMLMDGNIRRSTINWAPRTKNINGDGNSRGGSPVAVRTALNPGDIEAYVASKPGNSLDRTNLLALAISQNATRHLMELSTLSSNWEDANWRCSATRIYRQS